MKKPTALLFALVILAPGLAAAQTTLLTTGHVDLNVGYNRATNTWSLDVQNVETNPPEDTSAASTRLQVAAGAIARQPGGSSYAFIGAGAGGNYYRLPQTQRADLLYLGVAAYGTLSADFDRYNPSAESGDRASGTGSWVRLTLTAVRGPGAVSVWQEDVEGPSVFISTAAGGITSEDALWVQAGGHFHYNWGFTRPGQYELDFRLSGYRNDGNPTTLGELIASTGIFTAHFDVVPEPATWALLVLAIVALAGRRKWGRRQPR